jgi:hypothetical protein
MNNIQEKDWAEDDWHGHTGIDSSCDYCIVDGAVNDTPHTATETEPETNQKDGSKPDPATSTA